MFWLLLSYALASATSQSDGRQVGDATVPSVVPNGPVVPLPAPTRRPALKDRLRYNQCLVDVTRDPEAVLRAAQAWQREAPSARAFQCEGLAQAQMGRYGPAATAFELAGQSASATSPGLAAILWLQAGNAALANNDAVRALALLDRGLATGKLTGEAEGQALLDRARAKAAAGDQLGAREDLQRAGERLPDDPLVWLLSATMARRAGDTAAAEKAISRAIALAPSDAAIVMEAGNIAATAGSDSAARAAWEEVIRLAPQGDLAAQARAALHSYSASSPAAQPPLPRKAP